MIPSVFFVQLIECIIDFLVYIAGLDCYGPSSVNCVHCWYNSLGFLRSRMYSFFCVYRGFGLLCMVRPPYIVYIVGIILLVFFFFIGGHTHTHGP